jgi:hypothetical protein
MGGTMKNFKRAAVGICCFMFLAMAANAQMMGRGPSIPRGLMNPVVGSGAQYETQTADGKTVTTEFAIVGKESVNGKDAYWFEITTAAGPMGMMVMKTLNAFDASGATPSRVIMQMGNRPPMEMPQQMTQRMNGQQAMGDIKSQAELIGTESITTPAGTFSCEHYRMKDGSGDTWVSDKVTPLGVVKHTGKDSTMVLTKVLTDEKDKIVGTPQPFNPALFMQQPPANQ